MKAFEVIFVFSLVYLTASMTRATLSDSSPRLRILAGAKKCVGKGSDKKCCTDWRGDFTDWMAHKGKSCPEGDSDAKSCCANWKYSGGGKSSSEKSIYSMRARLKNIKSDLDSWVEKKRNKRKRKNRDKSLEKTTKTAKLNKKDKKNGKKTNRLSKKITNSKKQEGSEKASKPKNPWTSDAAASNTSLNSATSSGPKTNANKLGTKIVKENKENKTTKEKKKKTKKGAAQEKKTPKNINTDEKTTKTKTDKKIKKEKRQKTKRDGKPTTDGKPQTDKKAKKDDKPKTNGDSQTDKKSKTDRKKKKEARNKIAKTAALGTLSVSGGAAAEISLTKSPSKNSLAPSTPNPASNPPLRSQRRRRQIQRPNLALSHPRFRGLHTLLPMHPDLQALHRRALHPALLLQLFRTLRRPPPPRTRALPRKSLKKQRAISARTGLTRLARQTVQNR